MLGIGTTELVIILGIVLMVFGPKRLPELARLLAKATKMFHEASREIQRQLEMSEWEEEQRNRKKSHKPNTSFPADSSADSVEYSDGYYGEGTSIDETASGSSGDAETNTDTASSDSETTPVEAPAPAIEPKPEPIDDPNKTSDAQRYSREMTD